MRSEQSEDQNPSPGEKVARPNEVRNSGSEEECGRQLSIGESFKTC